jgi:hypothetical protein
MLDSAASADRSQPAQTDRRDDARRLNPEAVAALEPFLGSPLLANGQINLLSLDAVAERLGPRWAARRETVYDYTLRLLDREVGEQGRFLRVSETDFLIVLPDEQKFAAQLRCLRYLRDVLTFFLGQARPGDLTVREVTHITRHGLEAALVDPVRVGVEAERETTRAREAKALSATVDQWTPFVASDGRRVRVSCVLEPVFELKHYARIGNRIARRVLCMDTEEALTAAELQALSRSDIEKIDLATVARGLARLRTDTGGERQLSLIVPVSYISLSNRQSRAALASLFGEAKSFVETGVICEVCDIESVPQTALLEATSLMKPYCMFLTGGLAAAPDHGLSNLREAGLHAVSFEAPHAIVGDAEFIGWAKAAIGAAKRIAKSVMIYRLASPRHAGAAALLGASHASLRLADQTARAS